MLVPPPGTDQPEHEAARGAEQAFFVRDGSRSGGGRGGRDEMGALDDAAQKHGRADDRDLAVNRREAEPRLGGRRIASRRPVLLRVEQNLGGRRIEAGLIEQIGGADDERDRRDRGDEFPMPPRKAHPFAQIERLSRADLPDPDLASANLVSANLGGANLGGANTGCVRVIEHRTRSAPDERALPLSRRRVEKQSVPKTARYRRSGEAAGSTCCFPFGIRQSVAAADPLRSAATVA